MGTWFHRKPAQTCEEQRRKHPQDTVSKRVGPHFTRCYLMSGNFAEQNH